MTPSAHALSCYAHRGQRCEKRAAESAPVASKVSTRLANGAVRRSLTRHVCGRARPPLLDRRGRRHDRTVDGALGTSGGEQRDRDHLGGGGCTGARPILDSALGGYSAPGRQRLRHHRGAEREREGKGIAGFASGFAVYGRADASGGYAIYGNQSSGAYAGLFAGTVWVTGDFSASGTKSFLIDHPLDPTEKDLFYDGVATADASGEAVIQMPAYFEALNANVRYQLTAVGGPAPDLHVKSELTGGKFSIAGARPKQRACWQVTGTRNDAYARANPFVVEREKPAAAKGLYRNPEAHGQPESKGVEYKNRTVTPGPLSPQT